MRLSPLPLQQDDPEAEEEERAEERKSGGKEKLRLFRNREQERETYVILTNGRE